MKKRRFHRFKQEQTEEMALNITAMADIFTILLVFLLKSFASSAMNVTPSAGVTLPNAAIDAQYFEALKIEVSESGVLVDNEPVTPLTSFSMNSKDIERNGSSTTLNAALSKARQRQLLIAGANTDVKVDSKILIISDQRTPYKTLKSVLASAAVNGYTDYKLAVVQQGQ